MTPLFEEPADIGQVEQACDKCQTKTLASKNGLRVRGWMAYDGTSFSGKPLNVRICPDCRENRRRS